ncbi:MAG: cytochrome c oxidase accessory protein CcoG, partial [Wenzhouxiangella sp.]|nr:cytochrome c oxidase accessory protein CcoG [Wenzhouxiangella sp.]
VARGEPRGSRRRDADYKEMGLGDCIDCMACVHVCPTGIDIRDGLQIECIACASCIDVCDEVMDKMGYPRGLVRYTTENALNGKPSRIIRPRIFIYLFALLALATLIGVILTGREPLIADVLRDRGALYRVAGAELENSYSLKLTNRTDSVMLVTIEASGLPDIRIVEPTRELSIAAGQTLDVPLTVAVPLTVDAPGMRPMIITARDPEGRAVREIDTRFYIPPDPR